MTTLDDADLSSVGQWLLAPSPDLPRTMRRTRPEAGGHVAILRDTSMSMAGLWAEWSSSLCTSVVELAKRKRMGVGYIEFNTDCDVYAFPPNGGCSKRESGWNRRDRGIAGRRELREKT